MKKKLKINYNYYNIILNRYNINNKIKNNKNY